MKYLIQSQVNPQIREKTAFLVNSLPDLVHTYRCGLPGSKKDLWKSDEVGEVV